MDYAADIALLEAYRGWLELLDGRIASAPQELRRNLNTSKALVRTILMKTRVHKTFTVYPAPAFGGPVYSNVDPLEYIFNPPHGESMIDPLIDMIDEAIGVLQTGELPPSKTANARVVQEVLREGYAFVAMAIDSASPDLVDVLDTIKQAAHDCGILAERIDEQISNERITDRILEAIRAAEFVIVDLTFAKPNVFYEAGYAQGIGKTPVFIARSGTRPEFDIKDYPIIFFENMRSLREGLKVRFEKLIKDRRS